MATDGSRIRCAFARRILGRGQRSSRPHRDAGNTWLEDSLSDYADWAEHNNSLLIVTWDEDHKVEPPLFCPTPITKKPPDNHIATIIMGEPVLAGKKPTDQYTHHDLLRTILDMYGIAPFAGATTAKDITGIWK